MTFETIGFAREETFVVVTLNRPPANAISPELVTELNAALASVEEDDAVRSVIVTGAGDKIFCAGADLGSAFSGGSVDAFIRFGNSVMRRIERFPKPVIAAINGHALGGGCEIAMACHLRLLPVSIPHLVAGGSQATTWKKTAPSSCGGSSALYPPQPPVSSRTMSVS